MTRDLSGGKLSSVILAGLSLTALLGVSPSLIKSSIEKDPEMKINL